MPKGFQNWDKEKLREVAKMGGSSVPAHKRTFYTNCDLAKRAGSIGGSRPKKRKSDVTST